MKSGVLTGLCATVLGFFLMVPLRPAIRRDELGSLQYVGPRPWIIRFCVAYARLCQLLPSQNADPNIARARAESLDFRRDHSLIPNDRQPFNYPLSNRRSAVLPKR